MDEYRIDSHKLLYHVDRVNRWLKGENIYPIYAEVSPSGACNHRCIFCALDYLEYKSGFIDTKALKRAIHQAAQGGLKSIMFAGEGEPLLHPDIAETVDFTKKNGLDVSMTTNGVLFNKGLLNELLENLSWLRISLNAGRADTYALIHMTAKNDFIRVVENIREAVRIKKDKQYKCVIGIQTLLLPENSAEINLMAETFKEIGVDYLTIKPYSHHPLSKSKYRGNIDYSEYSTVNEELRQLESESFRIIFRTKTMRKFKRDRQYKHCYGLPFFTYISTAGDVYACSAYLGKKEFCYGSIINDDFKIIWNSQRRKDIVFLVENELDAEKCREACRLDEINRYLWELKHPSPHVNFI